MQLPTTGRRPGFVIAAAVVGLIVVLGVLVSISFRNGKDSAEAANPTEHTPTPRPSISANPSSPTPQDTASAADQGPSRASSGTRTDSICGLPSGKPLNGRLTAPKAVWKYDGTTGYPSSSQYGPGRLDDAGFRYCYQHSAPGALFAAAGAIAFNNRSEAASDAWSRYSLAHGPYRDQLLHSSYQPADPSVRTKIIGYRLLSYDRGQATVDLAVRVSTSEQTVLSSVLMKLVWQRGDWRFSTETPESVQATRLVDLAGYTSWSDD